MSIEPLVADVNQHLEQWGSVLATVLQSSLEPLRAEICVNTQRVRHLEDYVQTLGEDLAMWPQ